MVVEGERFAERGDGARAAARRATAGRGGRSDAGEPITGASRRPARCRRPPSRAGGAADPTRNRWWYAALGLVAGLILGAGGVVASRALGYDLQRLWARAPLATGPRTWGVGLEPSADFSTIGEALAKAAAGDTVTVGPGEYREAVTLKSGVQLVGSARQRAEAAGRRRRGRGRRSPPAASPTPTSAASSSAPARPAAGRRPAGRGRDRRRRRARDLRRARCRGRLARRRPGHPSPQLHPRQRGPRRDRPGAGGTAPRAQRHHPQRDTARSGAPASWSSRARARARGQRHRRQRRRGGPGLAGRRRWRSWRSATCCPRRPGRRPRRRRRPGRHARPRPARGRGPGRAAGSGRE